MNLTNLQTIKNLCKEFDIRPSKKLGQNFLVSKFVLDKIIAAADLKSSDVVLEIGPGFGALTFELAKRAQKVIAVEKDKRLAEFLRKGLKEYRNKGLKIINDDILELDDIFTRDPSAPNGPKGRSGQAKKSYKIVSNLPYQITSPVLWKFLKEEKNKPELMILMVQKEVAERIVAKPGQMSVLSVMCQFYVECDLVGIVSRDNFYPKPDVDSAIIKLRIKNHPEHSGLRVKEKEFFKFVKIGFSAKRKMLKNNLARGLGVEQDEIVAALKKVGLGEKVRAQEISVDSWMRLFSFLRNKIQETRNK